ncbi:type VI secretion system amidase effector protein Tae4 [Buttiauxella gaviniae]|uniref:Type VI secretion system amidase effector protein Tae4 n=1 Tax=Buttiauxella gaviniae TaxID=82990 RepID=A0ABV3NYY6_9ENTR
MTTVTARVGGLASNIGVNRPKFNALWNAYPVGKTAEETYMLVGGNVYEHYKEANDKSLASQGQIPNPYANACALRLSRAFNYGGLRIKKGAGAYKLRGGDGYAYIMRVPDMMIYVEKQFKNPDLKDSPQKIFPLLQAKKGILIFTVDGWSDARGHVTLWNGGDCGDHCYFSHANPNITTTEVKFWELK